jgi:phospho-N-acetylmuramoyl-pentapeptide-transferase
MTPEAANFPEFGPGGRRNMLTLLVNFADQFSVFNIFRYITFRTGGALITSALIVFIFGPAIINSLRIRQGKGQPIRADGPQTHFKKAGTPTMGGLMILCGIVGSSLLWANITSVYVWVVLLVTLGFGAIGLYDDYLKVTKQSHLGFSGKARLGLEFVIAAIAAWTIMHNGQGPFSSSLTFPFIKDLLINLGWFFIPFSCIVIVGAGNAVNLTDGLDGLAIVRANKRGPSLDMLHGALVLARFNLVAPPKRPAIKDQNPG